MNSSLPTDVQLGYCTNVHAGADLETTRANLARHAVAVKQCCSPTEPMGLGLWLSASTARKLIEQEQIAPFAQWLAEQGLVPFTLNGFPYGDFHQDVVKHQVYLPAWHQAERLDYTLDLIRIHHRLLPQGMTGSISTLPLGWGNPPLDSAHRQTAARNLRAVADHLAELRDETGREICLCIEPEPGCELQRSEDLVRFFQDDLLAGADVLTEDRVRRYLRICHDVCHAAVMFEDQQTVLRRFRDAGIRIGKIQVSSAIHMPLGEMSSSDRQAALEQLSRVSEPRYLHQTVVRTAFENEHFYQDLPEALEQASAEARQSGQWRVHFHVPIYVAQFGHLQTTRREIQECIRTALLYDDTLHFEVETYAWGVLPQELQKLELAEGIAEEMQWCRKLIEAERKPDAQASAVAQQAAEPKSPPISIPAFQRTASDFSGLLSQAVESNASDLHLQSGAQPMMRIEGQAVWIDGPPLAEDEVRAAIATVAPPQILEDLEAALVRGVDFSYEVAGLARFRCGAHRHLGQPALVLRVIRFGVPSFDDLKLPAVLDDIAASERGLTLVTGMSGSGKSTTQAALLERINQQFHKKIITIEDPVEFVYQSRRSLVSQLEVGIDTPSFEQALRQALRHDPDVIMIGELRDVETLRMALRAADTGHQVLATLHSSDAAQSIERVIAMFPPGEHSLLLSQLAGSLEAIVSQRLVVTTTGARRPAVEVLRGCPVVEKYVLERRVAALSEYLESGERGMQSFDQHLLTLYKDKAISNAEALRWASSPEKITMAMHGIIGSVRGITGGL